MTESGLIANFGVSRSEKFRLRLTISIQRGTTTALLGPNGAGKSTAVAAISGLLPVDTGRIALDGEVFDDPEAGTFVPAEKRRVGVVFQDYLLFPHLTVLDNVAFGLRSRGVGREEAATRSREWMGRLGMVGLDDRKPHDLSGGQAQTAALARALVTEPDLLLLDEPLSALDVTARSGLRHLLAEHLGSFPGPRLVISHDPTEAFLLADEIHLIEDGSVTQFGTADDIRLRPRTQYAADLAGSNLITGMARNGMVDTGRLTLRLADSEVEGPVLLTIRPTAISVHSQRPEGSPRNSWPTVVEVVEPVGSRVRLRTGPPLPLTVEVTVPAREELGLDAGKPIWIAFKATEIGVQPGERV